MMAIGVIGAVVQGIGAMSAANANAQADTYNAQVNQRNEQVALQQGAEQATEQQRQNEVALGRIQASYGAAGIEMGGDALGVYQDSATQASLDVAKVHYNAKVRSTGYSDQAQLDTMKAGADTTAGMFGMVGGLVKAGTSIFTAG